MLPLLPNSGCNRMAIWHFSKKSLLPWMHCLSYTVCAQLQPEKTCRTGRISIQKSKKLPWWAGRVEVDKHNGINLLHLKCVLQFRTSLVQDVQESSTTSHRPFLSHDSLSEVTDCQAITIFQTITTPWSCRCQHHCLLSKLLKSALGFLRLWLV